MDLSYVDCQCGSCALVLRLVGEQHCIDLKIFYRLHPNILGSCYGTTVAEYRHNEMPYYSNFDNYHSWYGKSAYTATKASWYRTYSFTHGWKHGRLSGSWMERNGKISSIVFSWSPLHPLKVHGESPCIRHSVSLLKPMQAGRIFRPLREKRDWRPPAQLVSWLTAITASWRKNNPTPTPKSWIIIKLLHTWITREINSWTDLAHILTGYWRRQWIVIILPEGGVVNSNPF